MILSLPPVIGKKVPGVSSGIHYGPLGHWTFYKPRVTMSQNSAQVGKYSS